MNSLEQQYINLNGVTLEVLRGGSGHPIICFQHPHSSTLDRFHWYADITDFIYVVMRGLGNSSPIHETRDLTSKQAVHDLEAVKHKFGIKRWAMQGYSSGSQIALLYALTYPDSLAGLIIIAGFAKSSSLVGNPRSLCSPKYPGYETYLEALHEQKSQRTPSALSSPDHYWVKINPQAWGFFRDEIPIAILPVSQLSSRVKAVFEESLLFDVEDQLEKIQVPTLVVGGRHDKIIPIEESITIHEGIPKSRLLVLENSGHDVESADEEIFRDTVIHFLASLST